MSERKCGSLQTHLAVHGMHKLRWWIVDFGWWRFSQPTNSVKCVHNWRIVDMSTVKIGITIVGKKRV